jgi:signal transduction histidine kinase
MGYGLAVAKELTEKLGGEISCESVLGQGTCFSIRIPVYRE